MKDSTARTLKTGPPAFDNAPRGFIVPWMNPSRLKAIRGFAAIAAVAFLFTGCETTASDPVPQRTVIVEPPVRVMEPSQPRFQQPANPGSQPQGPAGGFDRTPPPVSNPRSDAAPVAAPVKVAQASDQSPAPPTAASDVNSEPPVEVKQVVPPATPGNLNLSDGVQKVIKLTQAHTDEKVLNAFVERSTTKFDLDADEILYLSDVGVPSSVVAAMLKHDGDDPSKATAVVTDAPNTEATTQPALPANPGPPQQVISQQPQGVEVTSNYIPNGQPQVIQQQPQTVVVQQPQAQVVYAQPETVTYFYDSLSPYGSWMYVSDYGWCWQPTVASIDVGWRPYGPNGRWLWTANGWYWNSYYSWGWAPFHYGRWTLAGHRGWVWVPDTTWGPAWVSWRSSGDYCGWAPLPPSARFVPGAGFYYHGRSVDVSFGFGLGYDAFCFTPLHHFYRPRVYDYCLPRYEVRSVFPHTRVENRFEVHRDRFVNNGIPHDRVASAMHQEIRAAEVREMPHHDVARFGARERVEHSGRQDVVYRPNLSAAASVSSSIAHSPAPARTAPVTMPSGVSTVPPRSRTEASGRSPTVTTPAPVVTQQTPTPAPTRNFEQGRNQGGGRANTTAGSVSAPATPAPAPSTTPPRSTGEVRVPENRTGAIPTPETATPRGREVTRVEPNRTPVVTTPATPAPQVQTPPRVETPAAREVTRRPEFTTPTVTSTPAPEIRAPATAAPQITRPAPQVVIPQPQPARSFEPPQHSTRQAPVVMPSSVPTVRPPVTQPSAPQPSRAAPAPQPSQDRRGGGTVDRGGGGRQDRRGRE